jgi:hypothetical protein
MNIRQERFFHDTMSIITIIVTVYYAFFILLPRLLS